MSAILNPVSVVKEGVTKGRRNPLSLRRASHPQNSPSAFKVFRNRGGKKIAGFVFSSKPVVYSLFGNTKKVHNIGHWNFPTNAESTELDANIVDVSLPVDLHYPL
jgi:hypothetical protein